MRLMTLVRLSVALGALATTWAVQGAAGQDLALASRNPRFLYARSTAAKPIEVDVKRTPILRRIVSLQVDEPTVGRLLASIERQTGLRFAHGDDFSTARKVILRADSITVASALAAILYDADVDVIFSPGGHAALLKRQPVQTGTIVGRVADQETEAPMGGVSVEVRGTPHSATTGEDGRYRIADVPPGTYTLQARYIGYAPATAPVTVRADQEAAADFALKRSAQQLTEVVTTGTVVPTEVRALPSPITVITATEIREKSLTRVDQLFRGTIPGVFARDRGGADEFSSVLVRGGSSLQAVPSIKTYVDGVEVRSNSRVLSVIDPNSIERVELVRGPQASTLYGSEALDGVLQIFTKRGTAALRPVIDGQIAGGAIQTRWVGDEAAPTYRGNLAVSGGTDAFSYSIGGGRLYKGEWVSEYRDAENSLYGSVRGGQGWLTAEVTGRLHWQNRAVAQSPLFQSFTNVPAISAPWNRDANYQSTALGVTLQARASSHWQHSVTLGSDRFLQELIGRVPRLTSPSDTLLALYRSDYQKVTFQYSTTMQGALARSVKGSLIAGVHLTSDEGADFSNQSKQLNGALNAAGVGLIGRTEATNRGYFAQGQVGLSEALFLTAGVRAEDNTTYGEAYGLAWSPRVGLSYVRSLGTVTLKSRASYGKSIRAPFPSQRDGSVFGNGSIQLANSDLGPETQRGADVGLDVYAGNWATVGVTYYNQTAEGLIDLVFLSRGAGPEQTTQYQNVGEIKNHGLELEGSISPRPWVTLSGSFAVTKSRVQRVSPTYTGDLRVGDQLLGVAEHTGGANLRVEAGAWTANVGMVHSGTWTQTNFEALYGCLFGGLPCQPSGRGYWMQYPAFTKYRLAVSRRLGAALTAFANAENLTNSYAAEQDNLTVTPGRMTTVGLYVRF